MANGILVKEPLVYQKGDRITFSGNDYWYGAALTVGSEIYVNTPLSRPIISGTPVVISCDTSVNLVLCNGLKVMSNVTAHNIKIGNGGIQVNFHGAFDTTGLPSVLSPVTMSINLVIELQ